MWGDTECFARPADHFFAHRLATAKHRAQTHIIVATRGRNLTHHLEHGWHEERIAYSVPRHQVEGVGRIEPAHTVRYHGDAIVPARKQYIVQTADPGPVRRGPEAVVRLGEVLMIKLDRR